MLPKYGFDWPPVPDTIEVPLRKGNLRVDYAYGAPTIGAAPTVARNTLWSFRYASGVLYGKPGTGAEVVILTLANILEFGVCFDEDMRPVVTYSLTNGDAFYRIYDTATAAYKTIQLPQGAKNPRAVYDLKTLAAAGTAEVIIGYMVGKDIYVLQSSKDYASPRLAASYLQDLYLDQISFAVNNRLRFIMYQLAKPDQLPEVNPVPQSKYSCFLYRRPYTGGNPPPLNDDVATFSSSGLRYTLQIKDSNPNAPDVRLYPISLCLRPEWVDEIIATNKKDVPILKVTKTMSIGTDSERTWTLNQLQAAGGLVYDPELKLYKTNFDHRTEIKVDRSIIINITDLVVGESTLLIVDEVLDLPDLDEGIFIMKPVFPEIAPMLNANGYPLTDTQCKLVYHNEAGAKFDIRDTDPAKWNTFDAVNKGSYTQLYVPYVVGIEKAFTDTFTNPDDLVFTMSSSSPGNDPMVMKVTKAIMNQLILSGMIVLKNGYYYVAIPLGADKPVLANAVSWTYGANNAEKTQFAMVTDVDIRFSPTVMKYDRPSKYEPPAAPLIPESQAIDTLTANSYSYAFNATTDGTGTRSMTVDVYIPRAFFHDVEKPKGYVMVAESWNGTTYDKVEGSFNDGFPTMFNAKIKDNCYVITQAVNEVPKSVGLMRGKLTFRRLHDGATYTTEVKYERQPGT